MRGLNFDKQNLDVGSDIRLIWDGSNLLSRTAHTVICRYRPRKQVGYYALLWHTPNDGTWDGGAYSWGCHPFPTSGSVDGSGDSTGSTGSGGLVHYWESAGVGAAVDQLCTAGVNSPLQVIYDQWYTCIRKVRLLTSGPNSGFYEHTFIPDFTRNPSFYIRRHLASIGAAGANPAFYIGSTDCSSTTPSDQNEEDTCGIVRGIQLYNDYLSDADHIIEAANDSINAAQTSAGQTALWYINQDPTVADSTDKKPGGTPHNPT